MRADAALQQYMWDSIIWRGESAPMGLEHWVGGESRRYLNALKGKAAQLYTLAAERATNEKDRQILIHNAKTAEQGRIKDVRPLEMSRESKKAYETLVGRYYDK